MKPALNRRQLGLLLTKLANADGDAVAELTEMPSPANPAFRIGVTGAPGAGKSTIVGQLALKRLINGRIGVLAIDPSSSKSGGAILGDRIRIDELENSSQLYIRSLGSRSAFNGLSENLPEILEAMDRYEFSEVFLETVGVGQVEYAAKQQVDTFVLVLHPESGDIVQAMKAGISEMADIFVVNKSDLPGAQRMANDVRHIAHLIKSDDSSWAPPVILVSSTQPDSIDALSEAIDQHQVWCQTNGLRDEKLLQRARYRICHSMEICLSEIIQTQSDRFFEQPFQAQREHAAQLLLNRMRN